MVVGVFVAVILDARKPAAGTGQNFSNLLEKVIKQVGVVWGDYIDGFSEPSLVVRETSNSSLVDQP
jgi:hypothetical protein